MFARPDELVDPSGKPGTSVRRFAARLSTGEGASISRLARSCGHKCAPAIAFLQWSQALSPRTAESGSASGHGPRGRPGATVRENRKSKPFLLSGAFGQFPAAGKRPIRPPFLANCPGFMEVWIASTAHQAGQLSWFHGTFSPFDWACRSSVRGSIRPNNPLAPLLQSVQQPRTFGNGIEAKRAAA